MDVSDGDLFLEGALASFTGQTFRDFEVVLCAHGATETTRRIIGEWQAREGRLRVIWTEALPLARAHNIAARAARAPLLARLDADDVAMPRRFELQHRLFDQDPGLDLAGSAVEVIDDSGRPICIMTNPNSHEQIHAAMPYSCPIVHSTMMVRADAFWRAGGYREGLNLSEDYDLYSRLLESSLASNLVEPLVQYRVHPASLTSSKAKRMAIASLCVGAATLARRSGTPEPFLHGSPSLRLAQHTLRLSRRQLRLKLRSTSWQASISRLILIHRLPFRLNGRLRALALKLGGRPIYSFIFALGARLAEAAPRRRSRQERDD